MKLRKTTRILGLILAMMVVLAGVTPAHAMMSEKALSYPSTPVYYGSYRASLDQLLAKLRPACQLDQYAALYARYGSTYDSALREALSLYCPQGIVVKLSADELTAVAKMITTKAPYQELCRAVAAVPSTLSTEEQCQYYYTSLCTAMLGVWGYDIASTATMPIMSPDVWQTSAARRALPKLANKLDSNIPTALGVLAYYNTVEQAVITGTINGLQQALWNSLSANTRRATANLSGYQALMLIRQTAEYRSEDVRTRTEAGIYNLNTTYSRSLRQALELFCPKGILAELDPDELTAWAKAMQKSPYNTLTDAVTAVTDTRIENLSPKDCQARYTKIVNAMYGVWDNNTVNTLVCEAWQ